MRSRAMPPHTPYLGEFEYAVVLGILQLGDEASAVPLRELLEARTGRVIARGALYTALERLEAKGCLRSRMVEGDAQRGGRARRCFDPTAAGLRAARATHAALASLTSGLDAVLAQP